MSLLKCTSLDTEDSSIVNAWPGIATTVILYSAIGLFLAFIFECFHETNPTVYAPRTIITPNRTAQPLRSGFFKWFSSILSIDDDETLRVAGFDAYTLVRFLRMNLILSSFCLVYTFVILVPIYRTSSFEASNSFSAVTMDNLRPGSGRLWACWVSAYVVTGVCLYLVNEEWKNYMGKRKSFVRNGDPSIPGGQQFLYTVSVDVLPLELRSEEKLIQYFNEKVFKASEGGPEVVGCAVHLNGLGALKKLIDKSEQTVMSLETAIAQRNLLFEGHRAKSEERTSADGAKTGNAAAAAVTDGDDDKLEPVTTLYWLCLPGRRNLLRDDEIVVATGSACCSKSVNSVPHFRKILTSENDNIHAFQVGVLEKSQRAEEAARAAQESPTPKLKSASAFLTLRTRQAAADVSQVLLTNEPTSIEVTPAPDPRDIVWENATLDTVSIRHRQFVVSIVVKFFALFLFIPLLVFCKVFGDIERLSKIPGLTWLKALDPDSFAYVFITTQVPPLLQATLVGLLPVIFRTVAVKVEGVKQHSTAQLSVVNRSFGYQLVNVYFTLLGSTLASTLQTIIEDPGCIFALLGTAVPAVAGYFSQIVLINAFMGMGMEFCRVVPLIWSKIFAYLDKKGVSVRAEQRKDKVSIFPGELYPGFLFVTILGMTYAIIVPFMSVVTTIFFALAFVVYKHNVLFVYAPVFESGGGLFYTIHDYILTGLNFGNATVMAYFIIKESFIQFVLLIPLFVIVAAFRSHTMTSYLGCVHGISREGAVEIDAQNPSVSFDDSLFRQPEVTHKLFSPLNEDAMAIFQAGEVGGTSAQVTSGAV